MYAALWRLLPGRRLAKALQSVVLLVAVVAFCFLWLFPRIAPYMPFNDNTITSPSGTPTSPSSTATTSPR